MPGGADRRPSRRGRRSAHRHRRRRPEARRVAHPARPGRRSGARGVGRQGGRGQRHRHRLGRRQPHSAPRRSVHPPDPRHSGLCRRDGRHVLDAVRAGAAADGPDRSGLRAARGVGQHDAPRRRHPRPRRRRHHRRHRRHRGVPAADLPAVLPDQPARGHRLPGAGGVRHGSPALSLRAARPRLRAAALEPRLRAAGHHVGPPDSGSPRSSGDDPGRAAHELFGAAAGLRVSHQHALRRPAALRGRRLRRLLPARARSRRWSAPRCCAGRWSRARRDRWCSSSPATRCRRSPTR